MENLIITTEETCDLPKKILEEFGIITSSVDYFVDGEEFNTQTNHMEEKEFYDKMRKGADVKTTQVNQQKAYSFFDDLMKTGKDILHISFSSGLSGTHDSFLFAMKEINKKHQNKCYVVDSLCASAGQGLLVLLVAKKAREKDMTIQKLIDYANEIKFRINHIFTVDDLKYLVKGGRVGKTSATLANILRMKPLMRVNGEGKLEVTNKVFSRKLTIKKMFEKMTYNYDPYFADIFICEADCFDDAENLAKLIQNNYGLSPTIVPLDYFIGSHSGPGTLSLFYVGDKR